MDKIYESTIEETSKMNKFYISVLRVVFSLLNNGKRIERKESVFYDMLLSDSIETKIALSDVLKKEFKNAKLEGIDIQQVKQKIKEYNVNRDDLTILKLAVKIINDPVNVFCDYLNKYIACVKKQELCRKNAEKDKLLKAPQKEKQDLLEYKEKVLQLIGLSKKAENEVIKFDNEVIDNFLLECASDSIEIIFYPKELDQIFNGESKDIINECIDYINMKKLISEKKDIDRNSYYLREMAKIVKNVSPKLLVNRSLMDRQVRSIFESIGAFDLIQDYKSIYFSVNRKNELTDIKIKPELVVKELNKNIIDLIVEKNELLNTNDILFATSYMDEKEIEELGNKINKYQSLSETNIFAKYINEQKKKALVS